MATTGEGPSLTQRRGPISQLLSLPFLPQVGPRATERLTAFTQMNKYLLRAYYVPGAGQWLGLEGGMRLRP